MNKWKRLLGILVVGALLVFSNLTVIANAYDKIKPTDPNVISTKFKDQNTYVRVRAIGTAIGFKLDYFDYTEGKPHYILYETYFDRAASGVVVAPGYVLTAHHVVNPETVEIPEGGSCDRISDVMGRTSRTILIYTQNDTPIIGNVVYEEPELDIALIKYNYPKNNWVQPIPFEIECRMEPLQPGDIVCAVVHDRGEDGHIISGIHLRWGTIMRPGPWAPKDTVIAWLGPWDITLYFSAFPGDSGSPLFVFRHGKPILIGIVRSGYFDGFLMLGYAAQLPVIEKIIGY